MYFQRRHGGYSFIYYDPESKKNVRLSKTEHPVIRTDAEAEAFCRRWDAKFDALKSRLHKKLAWQGRFHNFVELVTLYEKARQEEAPNSWEDCVSFLKYYILPFFLEVKEEHNINNWHYHFEAFRDYLETTPLLKRKRLKKTLAYSTMNNIIHALNAFIRTMYRRRLITHPDRCRQFSNHKLNRRTDQAVIEPTLQTWIYTALQAVNTTSADLFWVSLHTGMRLNEILGISLADFFSDPPECDVIRRALAPYHLKPYGFISLNSQPALPRSLRDAHQRVPRKPLKGKKRIDPEDCRIIPVFDQDAYHLLIQRWNHQQHAYRSKRYGSDPHDYLLFNGISRNIYARHIREVQKHLKIDKLHTPHDTRHTYSTWLAEQTGGNYALCRMILGHSNVDITMRYVHLQARLKRQLKTRLQLDGPLRIAPESVNPLHPQYQNTLPLRARFANEINKLEALGF